MQSCTRLHPTEAAQGLPACLFWRSVPLTDSSIVRLPPMLPPGALDGKVAALAQARGQPVLAWKQCFAVCA